MIRLRIKELAAKKGVRLKDVASAIGVTSTTLSKLTTGKSGTTTDRLEQLCSYFECEPYELIEYLPYDEVEESEKSLKADENDISIIRTMKVEVNKLSSILDKLEKLPPKKRLAMTECFNHILETAVK
jgi:putative transcriptional regulator